MMLSSNVCWSAISKLVAQPFWLGKIWNFLDIESIKYGRIDDSLAVIDGPLNILRDADPCRPLIGQLCQGARSVCPQTPIRSGKCAAECQHRPLTSLQGINQAHPFADPCTNLRARVVSLKKARDLQVRHRGDPVQCASRGESRSQPHRYRDGEHGAAPWTVDTEPPRRSTVCEAVVLYTRND
jgi:hypothetical protein